MIIFLFLLLLCQGLEALASGKDNNKTTNALTYSLSGRFGDNMLTLYKALWLSRQHRIPLLYKSFLYSDQLVFHTLFIDSDQELTAAKKKKFTKEVKCKDEAVLMRVPDNNTLYVMNYFTRCRDWSHWDNGLFLKNNDKHFVKYLKKIVRPCKPCKQVCMPQNKVTIAVHVRKGGGYDQPLLTEQVSTEQPISRDGYIDVLYPLKFPPDSYYIEQLKALAQLFNGQELYVYLFTDDSNPQRLVDKFTQEVNNTSISFEYRKEGNLHNANVLEDFFAMTQFDCLIRGDSSYSKAAQLLGNYKVVIYPEHCFWCENTLIIDKVAVIREGY